MSIPYNENLCWENYQKYPKGLQELYPSNENRDDESSNEAARALSEIFGQTFQQPFVRGVQCIRDAARLVLKVPVRSLWTPIVLPKNWKQRERATINMKLAGYSLVQLASVPVKWGVALAALATSAISFQKAKFLLDCSEGWTAHLDGRASQLEALKEQGRKKAPNRSEYEAYKVWLYKIDPVLCRQG